MGVAQVLEATVIGVVILGATFFAVAFQAPPSPQQNPGSQQTEDAAYGAISSLNDLYIDDKRYNHSALSRALADASAGDKDPLVDSVGAFLPSESSFCLHLNNGQQRIELHCPKDPPGAAVGISYPIEPNWRFHYAESDLRYYQESGDSQLGLTEIPILNAHNVHDEGEYVNVSIGGQQDWQPGLDLGSTRADFNETAYSTLLQGDDDADYPSASIYMECERASGTHEPCYASDLTRQMQGYDPYEEGDDGEVLRFTVDNMGPGDVPADASLEIAFPVGLDVNQTIGSHAGFTNIRVDGQDSSAPETLRADLDSALGVGERYIDVEANVTDTRYAYKHVDANLGDGSVSSSQFLLRVQDKNVDVITGGDSRVTMISAPKPAGSAETGNPTGRWGVVLPIPYGPTSLEDLTFAIEDGDELIEGVEWPSDFNPPPASGSASTVKAGSIEDGNPSRFVWEAPAAQLDYEGYTFAEFQFEVDTDGTQTRASERFPFAQPEADFDGYDPPPQSVQVEPGIWWRAYPPSEAGSSCEGSCPGYPNDYSLSGDDNTASSQLEAHLEWRDIVLEGSTDIQIADFLDVQRKGVKDALQASDVSASPRTTAPGDTVQIDVDAEDLAHYVAQTADITDMHLETKVYAPWGIPDRVPVETFDHGRVAGGFEAPNDMLALYVNGDSVEDVVTASSDGNVYGLHGDTGQGIGGMVFGLPEASGGSTASPTLLDHGVDGGGQDMIAVGTDGNADAVHVIDGNFDERWGATKPGSSAETFGIDVGRDYTGDGVPEVFLTTSAAGTGPDSEQSRLTLWDGSNGQVMDGWDWNQGDDIVIPGASDQVGMANVGVDGEDGLFANTGTTVATNTQYVVNRTWEDVDSGDIQGALNNPMNLSASLSGAGLLGYTKDGARVFNLSGVAAQEAETVEAITEGDKHSGIAIGDLDGWVWGVNASTPVNPVHGFSVANTVGYEDIAMANSLEGYLVSGEGYLMHTRSGWTNYKYYTEDDVAGVVNTPELGLRAVDVPDAKYASEETAVSWWAGNDGSITRSTDRLESKAEMGTNGVLTTSLDPSDSLLDIDLNKLSTLDLSQVDFEAVHAVSEEEAWFVGTGTGALSGNGYVVHTTDGGDTLRTVEIDCDGLSCGIHDISHDGKHLWIAGDNGLLLTRNVTGMAADTHLAGNASIDDQARLSLPLETDQEVRVDNVTVTWDPTTKFAYGEAVTLANETSGDRDLWNVSEGCPGGLLGSDPYTESDSCSSTWGYDHGNTLRVGDYVEDVAEAENRVLDGTGTLTVGRFTSNLLSYNDADWYESSVNLPITWHVNVTFEDGTSDVYTVTIDNDGNVNETEASGASWVHPGKIEESPSFTTPSCLGEPSAGCPTLNSVNVTNVASAQNPSYVGVVSGDAPTNGAELYRLPEGSYDWAEIDPPVHSEYRDAVVNPSDPDRWVALGPSGLTIVSYDGGENWTSVPSTASDLRALDHTHPKVPTLVGGDGTVGERFTLNGYAQNGREATVDLFDEASEPVNQLEKIEIAKPPMMYVEDQGGTPVSLEVYDEHQAGGGGWETIHSVVGGPRTVNLTAASDDIRLRFNLETTGALRSSPMILGNLTLEGYADASSNTPDVEITFDLTEDQDKFPNGVENLTYDEDAGYLRLKPVRNPWLHALGNEEEGDWGQVRNSTTVDVGARMADMEVAENRSTLWVVTEAIYQHGSGEDDPPHQDPTCSAAGCFDNTLYAIDVETGLLEEWWDPLHFSKKPQMLALGSDSVSVLVGNETEQGTVYWMEIENPTKDNSHTFSDWQEAPQTMVTADAYPSNAAGHDDPVVSMKHIAGGTGQLYGFEAPDVDNVWAEMPALNDDFTFNYAVPGDALYGSRIVVTEARWNMTDTFSVELVQSARLHDIFEVTPKGKQMPLVPTYTLEVVAWIEDWR